MPTAFDDSQLLDALAKVRELHADLTQIVARLEARRDQHAGHERHPW